MRFVGCGFASHASKCLEFFRHFRARPLQIAMEDFCNAGNSCTGLFEECRNEKGFRHLCINDVYPHHR